MSLPILFAIALVPGLVSWWTGRRLLAKRNDPALAERFLAHNTRVFLLAFFVLIGVSVAIAYKENRILSALVAVVPFFGVVLGGFPLRRALYEESWGFAGYLGFMLRLLVGVAGFWILLVLTPYLVKSAGDLRWAAAAVLGLLLVLWNRGYSAALLRITGARPLEDTDGRLASYFARVDERSRVPAPERLVVPVPGGRLVNALALPSVRQPRVVFSSSLLELLEPDEVGAIYAHEVGHLEYFQEGRRLRVLGVVVYVMIAAALAWGLLRWSDGFLAGFLWPVLFFVLVRLRSRWMRGHETDTDLRAAELSGDAEALIRGLVRLHQLMLLPRRLATDTEKAMSHPSLARRVQAIRKSAGLDAEKSDEAASAPALPPETGVRTEAGEGGEPLFLRTRKAGVSVLLEPDRISWFQGVPAELGTEAPTFDALVRAATSSRTQVYSELTELRLEVRRAGASLVVVDGRGRRRLFELADDDVARVQRRLDSVDARLGTPKPGVRSRVAQGWYRLFAVVAAASSIFAPVVGGVSVPALFALVRPRPASLVAAGFAGLAACVYRILQVPVHSFDPEITVANTWLLGLTSLLLVGSGILWSRQAPEARHEGAWPLAATCWGLTPLHWGALLYLSAAGGTPDVFRLSLLLFWSPSAVLLPLSAAVALFFVRNRRGGRSSFVLTSTLVLVPIIASTTAFRDAWVDDPLVPDRLVASSGSRSLEVVARSELDFTGSDLRLSPSGETWATCVSDQGFCDSLTWRLGRVDGSPLPAGTEEELTEVMGLAFVDDERLVLLRRDTARDENAAAGVPRLGFVIERRSLGPGEPRRTRLPALADYERHLIVDGESWRLLNLSFQEERQLLRRFTGRWSDDQVEETVWELGEVGMVRSWATAGRGDQALVVRTHYDIADIAGLRQAFSQSTTQELVTLATTSEERSLASTRLELTCKLLRPSEAGLCVARDRGRSYLWRIDPDGGEPEAVGTYRSPPGEEILTTEVGVLFLTPYGPPYWLEPGVGLFELEFPPESAAQVTAVSRTGLMAGLEHAPSGQDGSVLVLYRLSS